MSNVRRAGVDREEPPPVERAIRHGVDRTSRGLRLVLYRIVGAVGRRVLVAAIAVATVGIFLTVLIAGIRATPGVSGILSGLFGGLFVALLFAVAALWTLISVLPRAPASPQADADGAAAVLDTALAETLAELAAVRAETMTQVKARSVTRVPMGVGIALLVWLLGQWSDDPPGLLWLPLFGVIGAVLGEGWAAHAPAQEYKRLYKARVLPQLAARFGDLTYRPGSVPDLQVLSSHRIFDDFDDFTADDEIAGTYRGMPLRIVELRLEKRSGDDRVAVFDGLLVELMLPRRLSGTTVIAANRGTFAALAAAWRSDGLEPVRLEDPRFVERYSILATDQVEARALLTPAFMERFTSLAARSRFALPGALADGNRLVVALPKQHRADLFEPPVYWKRAGGPALVALSQDIQAVLRIADTVIELDFWASGRARDR